MGEFLTSAQMRAIESAAMARGAATGAELMERAGRGVVEAAGTHFPRLREVPGRAAVLCGPGNNGGDGFVVARLLAERGWRVSVWLFGARDRLPPDAALNARRWAAIGPVRPLEALCADDLAGADLVIDAFFGTGLGRAVPEEVARALGWARAGRLVAVDILSGIDADDGRLHGPPGFPDVVADLTVSFQCAKLGHVLGEGARRSRALAVADIGLAVDLSAWREAHSAALCEAVDIPDRAAWDKPVGAHKYSHGHALVLGGGPGQGGAARLAARAALRAGAGVVTLGCPPAALQENAARLDAVMLRPLAGAAALRTALEDARLTAIALGPGLGLARARALVPDALAACRATVLDADALTEFEAAPERLFDKLHAGCVLTPHAGEFARLFPDLAEGAGSRLDAVHAAAARAGAVVLLKGPATIIAAPDGRAAIHDALHARAAPWLATAGAGDVLAGIIAGLLARGHAPMDAAANAVWLHVEAARAAGPGLIAEDLPEALPTVLRGLAEAPGFGYGTAPGKSDRI